ncbi:AgmX/PglI C-terminal domain-containing protein, partial [Myxococcota bacterium]|nr:AgmX/PglI C-terminal domain-containing protein [Myxococcota bacterium]
PLPSPAATPAPYGLAKNGGAGTPPVAATAATAAATPAPAARPAPVAAPAAAPPRPAPRPVAPAAHGDFTVVQVLGVAVIAGVALGRLAPSLALAGTGLVLVGGFGAFLLPLMNGRGQKSGTALLTLVLAAGLAAAGTFALSQAGTAPAGDPLATASLAPAPAAAEPPAVDPPIPAPEPVPAEPAPPEPAAPATASDAPVAAVAAGGSGPTPPPTPAASTEPRSSGPTPAEIAAADREAEKRAAEARARREQEEAARKEKQRLEDEKRRQQEAAAATRLADASGSTSRPAPAAAKSEDKVSSGASGLKSPTEVLTATVINAIVGSNVSIRRCFYDARDRGLDVSGKIVLKFTVQPDGQVKNSRIQSAQYAGTDLEGCVTGEVNRLQFPPFDGPDQSIKFPFLVR